MTDFLADTPPAVPSVCPTCEPERDPREYDTRYCEPHTPDRSGGDDGRMPTPVYYSGSGEVGGEDNRRFCDLIHRKKRLVTGGSR